MIDCTPPHLALHLITWMLVTLQVAEGTQDFDVDIIRRMRDVRSGITCSKFTGSYTPQYYCWLVDPCNEDIVEAPRFLYSEECVTDCEALPSEYATCSEWKLDDGTVPCEPYPRLKGCCKHRSCLEGQECAEVVPGISVCGAPQSPPTSTTSETVTTTPTSSSSTTAAGTTPREAGLPPPVSVSSSPAVNTTPSIGVDSPPAGLPSSSSSNTTMSSSSSAVTTEPSTVADTASPSSPSSPSLPIPSTVPQPVSTSPQTPSAETVVAPQEESMSASSNESEGEMHPSWMTTGIVVALAATAIICLAWFLESRDEDDESKRDDEMAVNEGYWSAISQKSQHSGQVLQPRPLSTATSLPINFQMQY